MRWWNIEVSEHRIKNCERLEEHVKGSLFDGGGSMVHAPSRGFWRRLCFIRPIRRLLLLSMVALVLRVSSAEQEADELRLGYFPNITHAQALYARATGEFERQIGKRIKWTAFNAGPTAIESLFTDAVDATFVGPSPTINGHVKSKGEKFVIVAGSASGGAGLVVRKDSGVKSDRDFGGKVVATPQLGNTQDVAARVWFAEKGYRLRERGGNLSLVPLSNPDQLTMFKKKQIDGAWTVEPWLARLEVEGGGELFLEEKTLWPGGRYVTTHLIVNKTYLVRNKQVVRNLIAALVDVTARINSDKTAAALVLNGQIKKETGKTLKEEVIQKAMARVEFTWDPISSSLKKSAQESHGIGFVKSLPVLGGIYSLSLLNEVLKEKDLPLVQGLTP
jgi:NitT/TauT family transport system substrate-binding protein